MVRLVIVIIFFSLSAFANNPKFVNLKGPFQNFIQNAKNSDFETQLKFWQSDIESVIPDVYSDLLPGDGISEDQHRRKLAAKWFPFIFQHSNAILSQFENFEKSSWPVTIDLANKNPNVDFSEVRVIALPSLMMFDGMVTTINGHPVALFGMDFFELVTQNPKVISGADLINNPPVIVAHEFTHVLHAKLSNSFEVQSLFDPLWKEGLAQVSSQMLVPNTDLENVLMERNLASKCTSSQVVTWAGLYLVDSKTVSEEDLWDKYGKWFFINRWQILGVPKAGYCLGYYVVLKALEDHSFDDLMKMNRNEYSNLVKKKLDEISSLRTNSLHFEYRLKIKAVK